MGVPNRKEYNYQYYRQRIQKQKENNNYVVECELCGRKVINSSIPNHIKTNYCEKHYKLKLEKQNKLNALKEK